MGEGGSEHSGGGQSAFLSDGSQRLAAATGDSSQGAAAASIHEVLAALPPTAAVAGVELLPARPSTVAVDDVELLSVLPPAASVGCGELVPTHVPALPCRGELELIPVHVPPAFSVGDGLGLVPCSRPLTEAESHVNEKSRCEVHVARLLVD
jgi:hypothetical protein